MNALPAGVSFPNERVAGRHCPACGADHLLAFYAVEGEASPAAVVLALCQTCALVTNLAFDESRATTSGEDASSTDEYARSLAVRWAETYTLAGKTVVEIGCGQGYFLETLCGIAGARGIGFDPRVRRETSSGAEVLFLPDHFDAYAGQVRADLIVCRHRLEYLADPLALLTMLRDHAPDTPLAFEVGDNHRVFSDGAFWDVDPACHSYFTRESLTRLFQRAGFEVVRTVIEADRRSVTLEAVATGGQKRDMPTLTELRLASQFVRVCSRRLLEAKTAASDTDALSRIADARSASPVPH